MKILTRLAQQFCTCIREITDSKIGPDISYPAWSPSWVSSAHAGKCQNNTSIRLQPLVPNPLQLTIHHYPVIETTEFGLPPASKYKVQRINWNKTPDIHISVAISYLEVFLQKCMHLSSPASVMYAHPAPPRSLNQPNDNKFIQYTAMHDLYCSPNIVRVIKSRRMIWARHVACMGEERGVYRVLVEKPEGRRETTGET